MSEYLGVVDATNLSGGSIHQRGDVIHFDSLAAARRVFEDLRDYYDAAYYQFADAEDGDHLVWHSNHGSIIDSDGLTLTLYAIERTAPYSATQVHQLWQTLIENGSPYPDFQFTIGPRGGTHAERVS